MAPVATVRRDRLCGQRLGVPRRPPVVASLCREVAVEEFRGRWVVARSATGPDDFVNGYLTPAGCFGDRARSSRAGKLVTRRRFCTAMLSASVGTHLVHKIC